MTECASPVHVEVLTQLQAHGIAPEYITYPRVTLTSASRLCVKHSPPMDSSYPLIGLPYCPGFTRDAHCSLWDYSGVSLQSGKPTLLDPQKSPKKDQTSLSWTLHQVQGALANPSCPLLAVKASQLVQVYDVDERSLKSQWESAHSVEHWVWLDAGTRAVVTEEEVLHWAMQRTKPRHQFSRHERLWGMEVVGCQRDASCMWMALSALRLDQGHVVGLTQLYWQGGQLSQVIETQAMALPQHRFSRNPQASTALLAAVQRGKERTGQFHVMELGPHQPGNATLLSARGNLPFKGAWPGDFPSAIQVLLFLADVEAAQVIHRIQLVRDILFATMLDDDKHHSLLGVCHSGKVLSISICPFTLCQYLAHLPTSLYLSQRVLQLVDQIS